MKYKLTLLRALAGIVLSCALILPTCNVQAATWHEKKLSKLESALYYTNVNFLRNILIKGKGKSISTVCSYKVPKSLAVKGTYATVYKKSDKICSKVEKYIQTNHPELLPWSNTSAYNFLGYEYTGSRYRLTGLTISWTVSPTYMYKNNTYAINGSTLSGIRKALKRADQVLNDYSVLPDAEKIKAYANWIAGEVTYDHAAYDDRTSYLRDYRPFDMISVFDNDPNTNVVCQGYTRAFQYLMDHSVFSDKTIKSRIVSGNDHSWNLVTIAGKTYFVDVTWYDTDDPKTYIPEFILGSSQTLDQLKNGTFCSVTGYTYDPSPQHSSYYSSIRSFYTTKELTVSSTPYDPATDKSTGTRRYYDWKQYC